MSEPTWNPMSQQYEIGDTVTGPNGQQWRVLAKGGSDDADAVLDQLILADAADLYRDVEAIRKGLLRLSVAGLPVDDAVILAPSRGGRLRGGMFLGHPVVEADLPFCQVAVLL